MRYQIKDCQTGAVILANLADTATLTQLSPEDIEWAINEHGICETEQHCITEYDSPQPSSAPARDASDGGDAGSHLTEPYRLPVKVFATKAAFDAWIAKSPAAVLSMAWDHPMVREAVEADVRAVALQLCPDEADNCADMPVKPSAVYHVTREIIALVRRET